MKARPIAPGPLPGGLTAIEPTGEHRGACPLWRCRCACGQVFVLPSNEARRQKSCGCARPGRAKPRPSGRPKREIAEPWDRKPRRPAGQPAASVAGLQLGPGVRVTVAPTPPGRYEVDPGRRFSNGFRALGVGHYLDGDAA